MLRAVIYFFAGTGLLLLIIGIMAAINLCTLTVKPDEAVIMKKKGRFISLKPGKSLFIPFLHPLWRCSLLPFTVETSLTGLENQDGALFTAQVEARFSLDNETIARAAATFFGRTREQMASTLIELMHRNIQIFLPAYDRQALEHNLNHLLNYVQDSLKEDAAGIGVTMDSFSLRALYEEDHS